MKKKLLSLLMICIMVLSSFTVSFAAEPAQAPEEKEYDGLASVTGAQAIEKIGTTNTLFLDLRAAADYEAGHVKGSVSAPVCQPASEEYAVPMTNQEAFIKQMQDLKVVENGTTLYLSCYAGTFCVDYAAEWLTEILNVPETQLVRVTGGTFGDDALKANSNFVSSSYALAAEGIILDVRATEVYYANGYLDGSIHQPLFNRVNNENKVTDRTDELAQNFNAFVDANKALLANNKVYILCNGGASGAAAATYLLAQKGITGNVFTIEGGANALKEARPELFLTQNTVAGADTVATIGVENSGVVIIDVRAKEVYDKGHLKTAISMPLFTVVDGSNKVTNGYDALAQAFLATFAANADKFAGKDIHVVCNSGASGAKAATKLLMQAGVPNADIFTVIGGGSGKDTEDKSVPNNSTYVSADQAVSVIGNDAYVIIDVRATKRTDAGKLEGSVLLPLFTVNAEDKNVPVAAPYEDELSQAFLKYVTDNKATLSTKTIYILCNSGATGAANATKLLAQAGITANVFTIEGGATNQAIKDAFAGNTPAPAPTPNKPTSPVTGETLSTGYILLMLALVVAFVSKKRFA